MSFFNSLGRSLRSPRPKKGANGSSTSGRTSPQKGMKGSSVVVASAPGSNKAGLNGFHHENGSQLAAQGKPLFLCQPFVRTALVKGSFKTIVMLPKYVDEMEWLALNVFEFYTHLNSLILPILDACQCRTMTSSPGHEYTWLDSATRQPVHLPAAQYIDYVLTWTNNRLNDENALPTKDGRPIPESSRGLIRAVTKQMARIFVHVYWHHFHDIINFSLEGHWNSFFGHFVSFVREFGLNDRADLEPLQALVDNFEQQGKT